MAPGQDRCGGVFLWLRRFVIFRRRRRRWWHRPRRVALVIAAPFLFVLFLLSLPIVLPFVGIAQARSDKRKRLCAERWPCGWCVAPLGTAALARADALFGASVDEQFGADVMLRIVRDLHACCPRCDAGHRYDEQADRFVLLHPREFAATYGPLLATAVAPAMAALAWPWYPPRAASHRVVLTRDGVCMGDDLDAPHGGTLTVPPDVDVAAIGEALLRSPWLAPVGGTAAWTGVAGPVTLVFGLRSGAPFVRRSGPEPVLADSVGALHIRSAAQGDPAALVASAERHT